MSEKKPFDEAIETLRYYHPYKNKAAKESIKSAIRVLEDWPKWEPLIEAAGKVDKHTVLSCFDCAWEYCFAPSVCDIDNTGEACQGSKTSIRTLLEVLPDKEKDDLR